MLTHTWISVKLVDMPQNYGIKAEATTFLKEVFADHYFSIRTESCRKLSKYIKTTNQYIITSLIFIYLLARSDSY